MGVIPIEARDLLFIRIERSTATWKMVWMAPRGHRKKRRFGRATPRLCNGLL
jgi:hypothetical protein